MAPDPGTTTSSEAEVKGMHFPYAAPTVSSSDSPPPASTTPPVSRKITISGDNTRGGGGRSAWGSSGGVLALGAFPKNHPKNQF